MISAAIWSAIFKLAIALLGFGLMRLGLVWMDKTLLNPNTKFGATYATWPHHVQAGYHIGRLVAGALVIGLALS